MKRLGKFWLRVAEEETGLVLFGRKHRRKGEPHPHHFGFLGLRHYLGTGRKGRMAFIRIPSSKGVAKFLAETKEGLQEHWHDRPQEQRQAVASTSISLHSLPSTNGEWCAAR